MPVVITPIKGYTTQNLAELKLLQLSLHPQEKKNQIYYYLVGDRRQGIKNVLSNPLGKEIRKYKQ